MVGITTYTSLTSNQAGSTSATKQAQAVTADDKAGTTTATGNTGSTSTVSNLARQLSEAAARAEARDASLSRKALGEKAQTILNQVVADGYTANKAIHDAEVPDTDDPELLARAKQATAYVNSRTYGTGNVQSPFAGLSRDQLALIVYDEGGSFTTNERHAAYRDLYDQEQAWRRQAIAEGDAEWRQTGKQTNFFTNVLEHYEGLSAIEQAQYPADYAATLQKWIDLDFNFTTHQAEGKGSKPTSLIEQLLAEGPYTDKGTDKPEANGAGA